MASFEFVERTPLAVWVSVGRKAETFLEAPAALFVPTFPDFVLVCMAGGRTGFLSNTYREQEVCHRCNYFPSGTSSVWYHTVVVS